MSCSRTDLFREEIVSNKLGPDVAEIYELLSKLSDRPIIFRYFMMWILTRVEV